ncbi:hypothetical protein SUGI_0199000 [Cryptomeria japonica]|nr:hypothetical protein SUGI_0199000 [Cryptomeria japonica]
MSSPWISVTLAFNGVKLEHLDLSDNYFTSLSIPPQVGELRRLKYLSLFDCQFSGQIPRELAKLQQMEHLGLGRNNLYGAIPRELTKLQQLEQLDLSYNHLHGAIPREMGNMSALKYLDLSWNDGLQSNKLGELRGLEHLGLSNMNLSMAQHTWLEGYLLSLTNLTALDMNHCGLSGEIPPFFANLSRLQQLTLSGNSFRGKIPTFLGALPLSNFDLSWNSLEGSLPSFSSGLSNLEYLYLQ